MELLNKIRELDACPACMRKIREGFDVPVKDLPTDSALMNAGGDRACDDCLKQVIALVRAQN